MEGQYDFYITGSTLGSLEDYEYCMKKPLQTGITIYLINTKTGKKKRFLIEHMTKIKGGVILKNSNNTIVLKRK